jgi:hypothetical protein
MTQTAEERAAYLREYHQRPEVIARRRAWQRAYRARRRAEELPHERAERLEYERLQREARRERETPEERETRLAKHREVDRRCRQRRKGRLV